jgi:hypothetical protein
MGRRDRDLPVVKPTGKGRLLEFLKDLLILALTCSALYLTWQSPIALQLRGVASTAGQETSAAPRQSREAVSPYGLCARNSLGLYGVSYDDALVGRAFETLSPFLGEALSTASAPQKITQRQWRSLLEAPGVYCAFQGTPSLSALAACLGDDLSLSDALSPSGDSGASTLVLSWDGSAVWLAWWDGTTYSKAQTSLSYQGAFQTALEDFSPNGAAFAYTLAQTDDAYSSLDPYVLVSMTAPQPQVYTASSPDFVGDQEALEQLLSVLGFQSGVGSAYESGGEVALTESGDRLRVNSAGKVTFYAGDESRYPTSAGKSTTCTAQEAALAAWDLLNRAAEPWKGDINYILTGVEPTDQGWTVTFQAQLDGVPVLTGEEGWCARFTVTGHTISDFTLTLRSYTPTGTAAVVPSTRLAAAALRSMEGHSGRLTLCYSDLSGSTLSVGWIAEDESRPARASQE